MSQDADRDLSQLYRAGALEEPPAWLDQTILTAAAGRDADQGKARTFAWLRWQPAFALAAALTLAISLALVVEGELEPAPAPAPAMTPQIAPAAPGSGERSEASASDHDRGLDAHKRLPATMAAPRTEQKPEAFRSREQQLVLPEMDRQAREDAVPERRRVDGRPTPPLAPAPGKPSLAAPSLLPHERRVEPTSEPRTEPLPSGGTEASKATESESRVNLGNRPMRALAPDAKHERALDRETTEASAAPRSAAPPAAPLPQAKSPMRQPSERTEEAAAALLTPEQWLREIEQLRLEGREEQARARLDQFRSRFPDYPLPASLQ